MGNQEKISEDDFKMNICVIGKDTDNFYKTISEKEGIKNYWTFEKGIGNEKTSCIYNYFKKLQEFKNNIEIGNIKECLLIRAQNTEEPEVNLILELMNKLVQSQYMPLVLFLLDNCPNNRIIQIDNKKYKNIDPRLIKVAPFNEDKEFIQNQIEPILLRFCSILNELGDRFNYEIKGAKVGVDLIDKYFPFNINICCVGRFGQGKSTGVNSILKEYKARESNKGCSQTKKLTFYQVENQPVKILDIPGFENAETVKIAIEKFKECEKEINRIRDKIHIILYFLTYSEDRTFMKLEAPILEELVNFKEGKVIYVITHSNPSMDDEDKEEKIQSINEGLKGVLKNSKIFNQTEKGGFLEANLDNVVFVNFHNDKKTNFKKFGITELYHKIHEFFIQSKDYKDFKNNEELNIDELNERVEILKTRANDIVFANKIFGGIFHCIPPLGLIEIFVIRKNAVNKIGNIFGLDDDTIKIIGQENKEIKRSFPFLITSDFCDSFIEKCANYYKNNITNIINSYEQAAKYFEKGAG